MQKNRLPPGVSARDFARALEAWKHVVGERWVFTSDEDLELYRDAYSPFRDEEEERLASAAVAPDTVEEVQQIVRVANDHGIRQAVIEAGLWSYVHPTANIASISHHHIEYAGRHNLVINV